MAAVVRNSRQHQATRSTTAIQYTTSPVLLLRLDITLFFQCFFTIPGIVLPMQPWDSGHLDELFPSFANYFDICMHAALIAFQLGFLLSLPAAILLPAWVVIIYVPAVMVANWLVCQVLNGFTEIAHSRVDLSGYPDHPEEKWVFVNGVAVG